MFRGLATRAMFRQALAESQAWTPIESPWTLPSGLSGWTSSRGPAGVAEDELVGGQRDRLADGVGCDPLGQRRGGGLGGLLGRRPRRSSGSSGRPRRRPAALRAGRRAGRLYWSSSLGRSVARPVDLARCASSRARS